MDRDLIIRVASLYLPVSVLVLVWLWRRPDARLRTGLLLGFCWNVVTLPLVHLLARFGSFWSFADTDVELLGIPLEFYLGWAILWGVLPQLAFTRVRPVIVAGMIAIIDLLAMPELAPLLTLESGWLVGEVLGLAVCVVPAHYLVRWTADGNHVGARVFMQAIIFGGVMFWLIPDSILRATGGSWDVLWNRPGWVNGILIQCMILVALPALSAAAEFARGHGTPIPFDPPRKLIRTGPYAYIANPMQLSAVLMLTAWGGVLGSGWVMVTGAVALVYSIGLADWSEGRDLEVRFGDAWRRYRDEVRAWFPRWRPSVGEPATLYIAGGCERCSEVRAWFERHSTRGLEIVEAELHPRRDLDRITYAFGDRSGEEQGVRALARGLEHIHLGWAVAGWAMRLPIVVSVLQLLVDASGGEARIVRRRGRGESSVVSCPPR